MVDNFYAMDRCNGNEWRNKCVQCAQAGDNFHVTGYLESDVIFLRNVGVSTATSWRKPVQDFISGCLGKIDLALAWCFGKWPVSLRSKGTPMTSRVSLARQLADQHQVSGATVAAF